MGCGQDNLTVQEPPARSLSRFKPHNGPLPSDCDGRRNLDVVRIDIPNWSGWANVPSKRIDHADHAAVSRWTSALWQHLMLQDKPTQPFDIWLCSPVRPEKARQ
jgi:hypothetical protein